MYDIHENDLVALLADQPATGLHRGDIGTVIQVFRSTPNDSEGFVVEFEQIRIRAGIHVGSPRIIGNDIFGNMVNYTKRVESAEENKGGIRLSEGAMKPIDDEKAQRHARLKFIEKQVPFKGYKNAQTIWNVIVPINPFARPRSQSISPITPLRRVPLEPKTVPPRLPCVPPEPRRYKTK